MANDENLESALRRISELEQSHEELAARQDESDTSLVKVLDVLNRIERNQRRQMEAQGVRPHDD